MSSRNALIGYLLVFAIATGTMGALALADPNSLVQFVLFGLSLVFFNQAEGCYRDLKEYFDDAEDEGTERSTGAF